MDTPLQFQLYRRKQKNAFATKARLTLSETGTEYSLYTM